MGTFTVNGKPFPTIDATIEREAPAVGCTISIRLQRQPKCPVCGAPLRNSVVTVRYDTAYCPPCANGRSYETLRVSQLRRHPELSRHFMFAAGITWFTPRCQVNATLATLAHAADLQALYLSLPFDPWGNQIHHGPGGFDPALMTAWKTPLHHLEALEDARRAQEHEDPLLELLNRIQPALKDLEALDKNKHPELHQKLSKALNYAAAKLD